MIPSIRTAVILAAGMGTRLGGFTKEQPKGFLEIDGQSLIERSIRNLLIMELPISLSGQVIFTSILICYGIKFPGVRTCRNEDYAVTGSMFTLYTLRRLVKDPFLLLESDLLYEPARD